MGYLPLAEAAIITESFLKYVTGGMGIAILALAKYVRDLIEDRNKVLQETINQRDEIKNKAEEELRKRYQAVVEEKDKEILENRAEITRMIEERFKMLEAQIAEAGKQQQGLRELSKDYEVLIEEELIPLIQDNRNLLYYYKSAREKRKG